MRKSKEIMKTNLKLKKTCSKIKTKEILAYICIRIFSQEKANKIKFPTVTFALVTFNLCCQKLKLFYMFV